MSVIEEKINLVIGIFYKENEINPIFPNSNKTVLSNESQLLLSGNHIQDLKISVLSNF